MFHESTSAYRRLHVQVNYFRIADDPDSFTAGVSVLYSNAFDMVHDPDVDHALRGPQFQPKLLLNRSEQGRSRNRFDGRIV